MGEDEVTTGELSRRLDSLDRTVDRRLTQVEAALTAGMAELRGDVARLSYVPREVHDAAIASVNAQIKNLYGILAALLISVIGYYLANSQVFGS